MRGRALGIAMRAVGLPFPKTKDSCRLSPALPGFPVVHRGRLALMRESICLWQRKHTFSQNRVTAILRGLDWEVSAQTLFNRNGVIPRWVLASRRRGERPHRQLPPCGGGRGMPD